MLSKKQQLHFYNWVVDSIQLNSNDTQFLPEYRSPCLKRIPIKYVRKSKNCFELNSNSKCEDKNIIELGTYEYVPVDPEYTLITIKFLGEKEDTIKRSSLNSTYNNTLFSMDAEIELMLAGVLDELLKFREGTNPLITISFWNGETRIKQLQTNQFPLYMSNFGKYIFPHPRYPKE